MDLMVLADSVLLPQDDLALATVLKSPLFGLDDEALFTLAWDRKGSLRMPRCAHSGRSWRWNSTRICERARKTISPFAVLRAGCSAPGKGGANSSRGSATKPTTRSTNFLTSRSIMSTRETPSLQGFVAWLRAAKAEIKRDMEMERDEVRVMTVHGAKGLEAPVVILADTTTPPQGWHPPRLLRAAGAKPVPDAPSRLVWAGAKSNDVGPMAAAREAALADARDEYRRLLYVAMTRAAERLIVCGTQGDKKNPDGCWYQLVREALEAGSIREPADFGGGEVLRYRKVSPEAKAAERR